MGGIVRFSAFIGLRAAFRGKNADIRVIPQIDEPAGSAASTPVFGDRSLAVEGLGQLEREKTLAHGIGTREQ
jgi:hypothetical protein